MRRLLLLTLVAVAVAVLALVIVPLARAVDLGPPELTGLAGVGALGALRELGRVKRITAASGGTLVAPNHESYRVRDLYCVPSAADTYLTLIIDGVTVNKLRVKGRTGNHQPYPVVQTASAVERVLGSLIAQARARDLEMGWPVASGQTFTVSRYAEAGNVTIVYDAYDRDDVSADEINGSKSNMRIYPHYMSTVAAITATPAALDSSLIWPGMDSWPVAARQVGTNITIELLAILGSPVTTGSGAANLGYTTHLTLLRDGDVLFDDEQLGLPLLGDISQTAAATSYKAIASLIGPGTAEYPQSPFWLPEPILFRAGATLTAQLIVTGSAGAGITAAVADIAFLLRRTVAGA